MANKLELSQNEKVGKAVCLLCSVTGGNVAASPPGPMPGPSDLSIAAPPTPGT